jgi:hypothetical protein
MPEAAQNRIVAAHGIGGLGSVDYGHDQDREDRDSDDAYKEDRQELQSPADEPCKQHHFHGVHSCWLLEIVKRIALACNSNTSGVL